MDKLNVMLLLKKIAQESKPSEGDYKFSDTMSMNEGKHAAAKEMIEAIRSSNVGAFTDALSNFISMCEDSGESEYE